MDEAVEFLREPETVASIERAIDGKLLPFVCLKRKRSVLIPIPFGTCLNAIERGISELPDAARFPSWT